MMEILFQFLSKGTIDLTSKSKMSKPKLIRITTVPLSLNILLKGQLSFMKQFFNIIAISSGPREDLEFVSRREGIPTKLIGMTRAITPFLDLVAVFKLFILFKKEKPLIVHSHTPKAGTLGMLAAKLAGVPLRLHTIAGLPLLEAVGKKRMLLDLVEKITYACASKIYPNSPGLYDIIIENKYCKSSKLKVIGSGSSNGIDTAHFDASQISIHLLQDTRKVYGISKDDFVFVFIGRLVGDKGINELVVAFKRLQKKIKLISSDSITSTRVEDKFNDLKLILVGPFEAELDPLAPETLKEIDTNSNIICVGYQADVRPYLAISDVLTFPSYREGFPNVVLQAGAMGLPCIVTNINGCNEIIVEGVNGTIIPVKNIDELSEAMYKMVSNKKYLDKLKLNSRNYITSRYEQQIIWDAILSEYKTLISETEL